MAIKIFISGNALRATDLNSGLTVLDTLKSGVYYFQQQLQQTIPVVKIGYLPLVASDRPLLEINLSDAVDVDSVAFTAETFRTFCNDNLGFDSASDITGGIQSTANSSTTLLTASSTFTGTAEQNSYADVMIYISTDQNGTYYVEFSSDGTNWDTSLSFIYDTSRINAPHTFVKGARYFRVRFTNTSTTDQTYLRLAVYYGAFNQLSIPIDGLLSENYDSISTRPTDYRSEVAIGHRQGRTLWNKFGYNRDIRNVAPEVIASWGGTFTPLLDGAETTLTISSTSNQDSVGGAGCESIVVYGIDADRNELIEFITLTGTTNVVTTSEWLGINRVVMFLCGTDTVNRGDITITATTGGSTMAQMPANEGVTQQCIFHVPTNFNLISEWVWINVLNRAKNAELTVKMWVYSAVSNGKQNVFSVDIDTSNVSEPIDISPNLPFPISEKTVIWLECETNTNNIIVNARFSGILERLI